MSRSGYTEDCEHLNLWRGSVERAIHGARGQKLLRDLLAALDAMPVKRLIAHELIADTGEVCALGALAVARGDGESVKGIDPEDSDAIADAFGIARSLACEIEYMNDEWGRGETPEERWTRMRAWVAKQVRP